jgi:predicted ATPase
VAAQPTGTVTLVFTDIEGSTRLLDQLGTDAFRDALAEHRRVVRDSFARADGYEVDYEGDAFLYAFASAQAAADAVEEAMRGLEPGPIRIRVGLHTGSPTVDPPKYVGRDVHLAARVMGAAHGGQVLLSAATRGLVVVEATDLGKHRLKDFAEPVSIFQLGEGSFPPLKTISNTNLPRPASPFVGREREVADVAALLREGARLVTLTGPGGSGKTRLAIEAAAEVVPEFKTGVFWIGLATLRDHELVAPTIAQLLGAKDQLAAYIGERELLLLLDNLEQVVDSAPELAALVETCPNLVLLVTSRELLRVRGELEYQVSPLTEEEAVSLFCLRSGIEPTAEIRSLCRRLDQMPLAVELAAARTRVLTPAQILDRLGGRLDLLKGGRDADPRQRTLRATIEWSYELLPPEQQHLFAHLAVFAGGFTFEAAEEVAEADVDDLQSLVEKSLLRHASERFWMLETIREFGAELLHASDAAPAVRRTHADWVLDWGCRVDIRREDQAEVLRSLHDELPNIRIALEELTHNRRVCDRLTLATRLAQGMWHLGVAEESKGWLMAALADAEACPPALLAEALVAAAMQSSLGGDPELGTRYAADALDLADSLGDPQLRLDTVMAAASANLSAGNLDHAERLATEALAQAEELGDRYRASELRNNLCYGNLLRGDYESARAIAETGLTEARHAENHVIVASLYHNLFLATIKSGAFSDSMEFLREGLEVSRQHSLAGTQAFIVEGVASAAARRGNYELTAMLLGATEASPPDVFSIERELRLEAELAAQSSLGEAFLELQAAGSRLSLEDASERAAAWLSDERPGAELEA